MATNRGKAFEKIIYDGFNEIPDVSIDRIPDQTMRYKGRTNVSDFIVFCSPFEHYIECKTVHGHRLSFSKITQFDALLEKNKIRGVDAGVICWWVDKDVTRWLPIESLDTMRRIGCKSISFDDALIGSIAISGRKKKVYFDYDLRAFINEIRRQYERDDR